MRFAYSVFFLSSIFGLYTLHATAVDARLRNHIAQSMAIDDSNGSHLRAATNRNLRDADRELIYANHPNNKAGCSKGKEDCAKERVVGIKGRGKKSSGSLHPGAKSASKTSDSSSHYPLFSNESLHYGPKSGGKKGSGSLYYGTKRGEHTGVATKIGGSYRHSLFFYGPGSSLQYDQSGEEENIRAGAWGR